MSFIATRRRSSRSRGGAFNLNFSDLRPLHESNRAVDHAHEVVKSLVHAVHSVERRQVHPDDLRIELDLALDVLGANREMMNSVWQTHR